MSHSHLTQSEFWIGFAHYIALLLLKFVDSWSFLDSVCVNRPVVNKLLDLDNPRTQREYEEHALVENQPAAGAAEKIRLFECLRSFLLLKCLSPELRLLFWLSSPRGRVANIVSRDSGDRCPMVQQFFEGNDAFY